MKQKLALQQKLELVAQAKANDLAILEEYRDKDVVMDVRGYFGAIRGTVENIGEEFISLSKCGKYGWGIDSLEYQQLSEVEPTFDRTISRSEIEGITLFEDLMESLRGSR